MPLRRKYENRSAGFTMIELMVSVVIVGLLSATAAGVYGNALDRAHQSALLADSANLYRALLTYRFDHNKFPSESDFDVATLDPLRSEGYFSGAETLTNKLEGGEALIYLAPDVGGPDTQFILVARAAFDRDTIIAVVYTDVIDEDGEWYDGVFIIDNDDLEEADEELEAEAPEVLES